VGALQRFMSFLGFSETYEEESSTRSEPDGEGAPRRRGQLLSLHAHKQLEIVVNFLASLK